MTILLRHVSTGLAHAPHRHLPHVDYPKYDTFNSVPSPLHVLGNLTHWGRVTHLCVSILTTIGSDNGSSPGRRQAIIWTNAGILLIEPLGTNFSEILIETHTFSFKKIRLKMSSGKRWPFCLRLNVLSHFYGGMCLFKLRKNCMADLSYSFIPLQPTNTFSCISNLGSPDWKVITVLTQDPTVYMRVNIKDALKH